MSFCYKTATIWKFIGEFLLVLKILIPIIIIVLGIIDFGKSAISNDEKAMRNSSMKLFKKILAGILIFFIPVIIKIVFSMVGFVSKDMQKDYMNCIDCLTSPNKSCDTSYKGNIFKK